MKTIKQPLISIVRLANNPTDPEVYELPQFVNETGTVLASWDIRESLTKTRLRNLTFKITAMYGSDTGIMFGL